MEKTSSKRPSISSVARHVRNALPASNQHGGNVGAHHITSSPRAGSSHSSGRPPTPSGSVWQRITERRSGSGLPLAVPGNDRSQPGTGNELPEAIQDLLDKMPGVTIKRDDAGDVVFLVDPHLVDVAELLGVADGLARCGRPAQGASLLVSLVMQGKGDLHPDLRYYALKQIDCLLGMVPNEIVTIDEQLSMLPDEPVARQQKLDDICNKLVMLHHAAFDSSSEFMMNCVNDKLLEIGDKHAGASAGALQECAMYRDTCAKYRDDREEFEAARLDLVLPRLAPEGGSLVVIQDDSQKTFDFARMLKYIDLSTRFPGSLPANAIAAYIEHAKHWPEDNPFTPSIERKLWLQHARANPHDAHAAIEAWKKTLVVTKEGKWEGLSSAEVEDLVLTCEAWPDAGSCHDAEQALQLLNSLPKHVDQEFVKDAVFNASLRICARGKLEKTVLEKQMVTIFLHPSLGKLSGAEQVPFVECLMQLDAAWLSRRINYPPFRFREVADGIIDAKNGVGLDDLLKPRHVELPHPGLLDYVSLPKLVGLLHQTLQGALTKPQWNSLVISAVNVVGDSKHVYAYMMDIFLIIVRQSPTVEKTIIDKLLPWLLETPDRSDMWRAPRDARRISGGPLRCQRQHQLGAFSPRTQRPHGGAFLRVPV